MGAVALDPACLGGSVTVDTFGGEVVGTNMQDISGNGYGGSVS